MKFKKVVTMSAATIENKPLPGSPVDLRGHASLLLPLVPRAACIICSFQEKK
jgi:hypothetical protein